MAVVWAASREGAMASSAAARSRAGLVVTGVLRVVRDGAGIWLGIAAVAIPAAPSLRRMRSSRVRAVIWRCALPVARLESGDHHQVRLTGIEVTHGTARGIGDRIAPTPLGNRRHELRGAAADRQPQEIQPGLAAIGEEGVIVDDVKPAILPPAQPRDLSFVTSPCVEPRSRLRRR